MTNLLKPGKTIGIIGGGQLGQMMAMSAKEMGFVVGVLDPTPNCPASQVADWTIVAAYDDAEKIAELENKSDCLTYEFENVNAQVLAEKVPLSKLPQGLELLKISQHRGREKTFFETLGLPMASFSLVETKEELVNGLKKISTPAVLKTCSGGYDGKGQVVIHHEEEIDEALLLVAQGECILEEWLEFSKEVSVIVSGTTGGTYEVFPIAENEHRHNVLYQTIVPARVSQRCEEQAKEIGLKIAKELQVSGTMTVELFVTEDERLLVNEMAPRPHNSGHYTIEACNISQFDGHIRGICGWPLPKIYLHQPSIMVNLLGDEMTRSEELISEKPNWFFHYYGKEAVKPGRKMGHITMLTEDVSQTEAEIKATKIWNQRG
ncbi:MAG: 5-(carboxyamino)imidazole ribonucleotide synthase [Vagococcus sp.]